MITICLFCRVIKADDHIDDGRTSHGQCRFCVLLFNGLDIRQPALLPHNPGPCEACGYLEEFNGLYASESKGYPVAYRSTQCVKRRGFCPKIGHYLNMEEQEIVTVRVSKDGRTWEERYII